MPASRTEPGADPLTRLSDVQRDLLTRWLGELAVVRDHSWPLQTTAVLEVRSAAGHAIVKASTDAFMAHHLTREIAAHRDFLADVPHTPRLVAADDDAQLLVTRYVPGVLVEGTPWEEEPEIYRQAGRILAHVHSALPPREDAEYQPRSYARCVELLTRARSDDLLDGATHDRASRLLESIAPGPVAVVPTHGDMQPRNWIVNDSGGVPHVTLIDFGRAEWRPWYSDVGRLHHQAFVDHPELAAAFYDGAGWTHPYPVPEEERSGWLLENLLQSISTVTWATDLGDPEFADLGRRTLARVLRIS